MEDQNQTNPPAGENPRPESELPPVPPELAPDMPVTDVTPLTPVTPVTPVTAPEPEPSVANTSPATVGPVGVYPAPLPSTTAPNYTPATATHRETNAWAIVSLISSILSWVGLFGIGGIVGVIAGMVARNQIRDSAGRQEGDGLALAGIILGGANILISCLLVVCGILFFAGMFTIPFLSNGR